MQHTIQNIPNDNTNNNNKTNPSGVDEICVHINFTLK